MNLVWHTRVDAVAGLARERVSGSVQGRQRAGVSGGETCAALSQPRALETNPIKSMSVAGPVMSKMPTPVVIICACAAQAAASTAKRTRSCMASKKKKKTRRKSGKNLLEDFHTNH